MLEKVNKRKILRNRGLLHELLIVYLNDCNKY